jgi:nonsense-mediated mRNA decay protein 3
VCGIEETPSAKLDGGFCPRCLARENQKAVPHNTETIRLCRICRSLEERGKWIAPSSRGLEEDLLRLIKRNARKFAGTREGEVSEISVIKMPMPSGLNSTLIPISVKTQTKNHQAGSPTRDFEIRARLTPTICPNCLLMKSKYYEATLQVRTLNTKMPIDEKEGLLSQIGNWVEESSRKDRQAYISKYEDKPEGFDLYLGSRRLAYIIASKLKALKGTSIRETYKIGRVDKSTGKRKGKATILVRLGQELTNQQINISQNLPQYPKD